MAKCCFYYQFSTGINNTKANTERKCNDIYIMGTVAPPSGQTKKIPIDRHREQTFFLMVILETHALVVFGKSFWAIFNCIFMHVLAYAVLNI